MVAQLAQPVLRPLMMPAIPPVERHMTYGYRRGSDMQWQPTRHGLETAAMAQRVLLAYVLGFASRRQLSQRYYVSETQIQNWIKGTAHGWLTRPVRGRLLALGIGTASMRRSEARPAEIRAALERLAAVATDALVWPEHYSEDQRSELALDLYLISGAWRDDA